MTRVRISELKSRLSEHLRRVEAGEEFEVLDRARPIARVVPIAREETLLELVAPTRTFASVRSIRRTRAKATMSSLDALLRDRGTR